MRSDQKTAATTDRQDTGRRRLLDHLARLLSGGSSTPRPPGDDARAVAAAPAVPQVPPTKPPARTADTVPRDGEAARLRFRTDRVFSQNGAWYIATREGMSVGPYDNPESARQDARRLIRLLKQKSAMGKDEQALTIVQFMKRVSFDKHST